MPLPKMHRVRTCLRSPFALMLMSIQGRERNRRPASPRQRLPGFASHPGSGCAPPTSGRQPVGPQGIHMVTISTHRVAMSQGRFRPAVLSRVAGARLVSMTCPAMPLSGPLTVSSMGAMPLLAEGLPAVQRAGASCQARPVASGVAQMQRVDRLARGGRWLLIQIQ